MDNLELLKILQKVEQDTDIPSLFQYEDTNSWVHVKFAVYSLCLNRRKNIKSNSKHALYHYARILRKSVAHVNRSQKRLPQNLFFGSSRGLNYSLGTISDAFFPHDLISLQNTAVFLNLNDFGEYTKYAGYLNDHQVVHDNLFHPIVKMQSRLFRGKGKQKDFSNFVSVLSSYGINMEASFIAGAHEEFIARYQFFKRLIRRFPKAANAYIVSSYSKSYITAALRHYGIHCIEIQHGHIGRTHVGYHYEDANVLPIPHEMLVYNEFWASEIRRSNFVPQVRIYEKFQYRIVKDMPREEGQKFLLFTGQGINSELVDAFIQKSAVYLKQKAMTLVYKPHPSEHQGTGSLIKTSCAQNDLLHYYEGEKSTEQLIMESFAHISISSFCHFDAIHLKGKTYVLEQGGAPNIFDEFIDHYSEKFIRINKIEEVCL